jgi:transposase
VPRFLPDDHHCPWREEAEELAQRLTAVEAQLAKVTQAVFGKKSEKMPSAQAELRREQPVDAEAAQAKRRARAAAKAQLPTREIVHEVPKEDRRCPRCGGTELRALGAGKKTVLFEYVPGRMERQVHVQETLSCACGQSILTAPGPTRFAEKSGYGPGFVAHVVTAKCSDSIPLHRLEKGFAREGVPIGRATFVDLFHRAAHELEPISARLLEHVSAREVVQADETPMKTQAPGKCRTSYLWTFLAKDDDTEDTFIAYRFSPTRAGVTPVDVLGGTQGALVVDAYTGYNRVTTPEGRTRVGCWAHARRKFFEALPSAPKAKEALALILELYRVEAAAKHNGIVRSPAHLALRQEKSRSILDHILQWLLAEQGRHPPRGALGMAIRYALAQWTALGHFVEDARLPLDNNASERALRVAALGRKNFLFVGHDQAGQRLAGLYSLAATCDANGINPREYLTDVLLRVQSHPAAQLNQLLPPAWKRLRAADSS